MTRQKYFDRHILAGVPAGAIAATFAASAVAGPDWIETMPGPGADAGSLPTSAQATMGVGPLNTISGQLTGNQEGILGDDFQDMYLIFINDPILFSASTFAFPGMADFDPQLWLFDINGFGILGNDEITLGGVQAQFGFQATDGSGSMVTAPGLYYLAISGFDSDPTAAGLPIFDQVLSFEVSGPDGPGGLLPIDDWTGPGEFGSYTISLTGASFAKIPAPGALAVFALAGATARRRRRRTYH